MTKRDFTRELEAAAQSTDFSAASSSIVDAWSAHGVDQDIIEQILRFMESHTGIDFGSPGPLVHFMESFFGNGYEDKLIESVRRRPTPHTVWMLNRVVNATSDSQIRRTYMDILEQARFNPAADENTRKQISHFLQRGST